MSTETRCQSTFMRGWNTVRCQRSGKVQRDGKWYCGTHDPERIAAKQRKKREQWKSEDEKQRELTGLFGKHSPWVKKETWGYRISFNCSDEQAVRKLALQFQKQEAQ